MFGTGIFISDAHVYITLRYSVTPQAIEDMYFTKEDQRILGKLLNKVKSQSDVNDKHAAEGQKTAELSALQTILSKYKVSSDDMTVGEGWRVELA